MHSHAETPQVGSCNKGSILLLGDLVPGRNVIEQHLKSTKRNHQVSCRVCRNFVTLLALPYECAADLGYVSQYVQVVCELFHHHHPRSIRSPNAKSSPVAMSSPIARHLV